MYKRRIGIYNYPLERVNEGTMLGNGHIGLFVWGEGRQLNISVGCCDVWDHRGGMEWTPEQNLKDIQTALYGKDIPRLKSIFDVVVPEGEPRRPSLIPIGRISMTLKNGCKLVNNEINYSSGILTICYEYSSTSREIRLELNMDKDEFAFSCIDLQSWKVESAYALSTEMKERGFVQPDSLDTDAAKSFIQPMPKKGDAPYGLCAARLGSRFHAVFGRGCTNQELIDLASKNMHFDSTDYWRTFWDRQPEISFADEKLQNLYYRLMFIFESMTALHGGPAGLQGPWIEDNGLPAWSGDFHFNINVQMCYAPALRARSWDALKKLFDMVFSWRDKLRRNAKMFLGIDDGYMLPHAVDDTGHCMGGFWTGTLDHGCTAWVAQMMFDYVDYSGDIEYLRANVFDFMQGAFNVYYGMMSKKGGKLSLPVTISPEYRGSAMNAWGANASFQLAACHRLTRNLIRAAEMLGKKPKKEWLEVEEKLPQASLAPFVNDWSENGSSVIEGEQEIALWDGQYLDVSHRHHSHLAALYPFNTLDKDDPQWSKIIANSIRRWSNRGISGWTGWCMTWATALRIRLDQPELARVTLDLWRLSFVNKGGATTHDACIPGLFEFCGCPDIIQLDASCGALSALQDMLLHDRNGVLHIFAGLTCDARFAGMPAPGGYLFDGSLKGGSCEVHVAATRDGILCIKLHGVDGRKLTCTIDDGKPVQYEADSVMRIPLSAGEKLTLCSN